MNVYDQSKDSPSRFESKPFGKLSGCKMPQPIVLNEQLSSEMLIPSNTMIHPIWFLSSHLNKPQSTYMTMNLLRAELHVATIHQNKTCTQILSALDILSRTLLMKSFSKRLHCPPVFLSPIDSLRY